MLSTLVNHRRQLVHCADTIENADMMTNEIPFEGGGGIQLR